MSEKIKTEEEISSNWLVTQLDKAVCFPRAHAYGHKYAWPIQVSKPTKFIHGKCQIGVGAFRDFTNIPRGGSHGFMQTSPTPLGV